MDLPRMDRMGQFLLIYLKIIFAFLAVASHLQAHNELVIYQNIQVLLICTPAKPMIPFLYMCRTLHFSLLNLILFIWTYCSSHYRSFKCFFFFSKLLSIPSPSFVSLAYLIIILSNSSSRLLIKMLNNSGSRTVPHRTLDSNLHTHVEPFMNSPWLHQSVSCDPSN